MKSEFVNDGL